MQNGWHEADLTYRAGVESTRAELIERMGKVEGQIRWFLATYCCKPCT